MPLSVWQEDITYVHECYSMTCREGQPNASKYSATLIVYCRDQISPMSTHKGTWRTEIPNSLAGYATAC